MGLRLKDSVNPEELRKFGFKTGKEWAEQGGIMFTRRRI